MIDPKRVMTRPEATQALEQYAKMVSTPGLVMNYVLADHLYGPRAKGIYREILSCALDTATAVVAQPDTHAAKATVSHLEQLNKLVTEFMLDRTVDLTYALLSLPENELFTDVDPNEPGFNAQLEALGIPEEDRANARITAPCEQLARIIDAAAMAAGGHDQLAKLQKGALADLPAHLNRQELFALQIAAAISQSFANRAGSGEYIEYAIHGTFAAMRCLRDLAVMPTTAANAASPDQLAKFYFDSGYKLVQTAAGWMEQALDQVDGLAQSKATHCAPNTLH